MNNKETNSHLYKRKYTDCEINKMIDLYNNGMNCKEIGRIFHGDGSHICKILRLNGITIRAKGTWITPEKELEIINRYNNNDRINDILADYKIGGNKLASILRSNGINYTRDELKKKRLSDNRNDIVYMYNNGYSSVDIAHKYRVSHHVILDFLRNCNVEICNPSSASRVYPINEHYFDVIDTEEKAYFFGLLFADGNITGENVISISLQEEDGYLLYMLNENIQPAKPLLYHEYSKPENNLKNQYSVSYHSFNMYNVLNSYGLVPRKSLVKKFPDIISNATETIIKHFIRGYFDGNGSIVIKKINKDNINFSISINSTKEMCETIKLFMLKYCYDNDLSINIKINLHSKDESINNYVLIITSKYSIYIFLKWIYTDAATKMYRKYNKYLILCKYLQVNYNE